MLKHYDDVIQDQEKQGIVEPVEQGTNNGVGKVHNLPHHEVIRVDKDITKLPDQEGTHQLVPHCLP